MATLMLIKESRATSFLRDISRLYRVLISISSIAFLFVAWIIFLHIPAISRIERYQSDIKILKSNNRRSFQLLSELPILRGQNEKLSTQLKEKALNLGSEATIEAIMEIAHSNDLSCTKLVFNDAQNFTMGLRGHYGEIIAFFEQLKKSKIKVNIKDLSMSPIERDKIELTINLGM